MLEEIENAYWDLLVLKNLFYFVIIYNCYDKSPLKHNPKLLNLFGLYEKRVLREITKMSTKIALFDIHISILKNYHFLLKMF